jgi:hypothetical protein
MEKKVTKRRKNKMLARTMKTMKTMKVGRMIENFLELH